MSKNFKVLLAGVLLMSVSSLALAGFNFTIMAEYKYETSYYDQKGKLVGVDTWHCNGSHTSWGKSTNHGLVAATRC